MNLKKLIKLNSKNGTYTLEAVIIVPIFILAVLALISIVTVISTCENITFSTADEVKLLDAKAYYIKLQPAFSNRLGNRITDENKNIHSFCVNDFLYLYSRNKIDDLIKINFSSEFSVKNPVGLFNTINFSGTLVSRGFTGTKKYNKNMEREEFEKNEKPEIVYIFPNWGKKYHSKFCTYITSSCMLVRLDSSIRKKYSPCKLCNAKSMPDGSMVYCFFKSGTAYHSAKCKTVKKYYIEIEKDDAIKKGYTPCLKCGGVPNE